LHYRSIINMATEVIKKTAQDGAIQSRTGIRDTINDLTERIISELQEEKLTPMEKLALLKTLLPYAVGKVPTVAVNYRIRNGQPTSGRLIEPTEDGGDDGSVYGNW